MVTFENARVTFDPEANAWYISLDRDRDGTSLNVCEAKRTVALDYDETGAVLGIEIL